jgi:sirohydrochlorin ferrochelatase
LRHDLPTLVAAERRKHPQVEIKVGRSLEDHPEMPSLILGRIQEVMEEEAEREP